MRIAFIYKYFPSLGGAERVMTVLANEFVEKGVRNCYILFSTRTGSTCLLVR